MSRKSKKHICDHPGCGKSFDSRWSLTRHVRIHTGEKPHVCTFPGCDKGFVERSALTRHLQTHSDDKPFECHMCLKRFKCKEYLDVHLRTHEDAKNFQCAFPGCGRIYSTRRGLRKHRLKAHDSREQKGDPARPRAPRTSHVKKEKAKRAPAPAPPPPPPPPPVKTPLELVCESRDVVVQVLHGLRDVPGAGIAAAVKQMDGVVQHLEEAGKQMAQMQGPAMKFAKMEDGSASGRDALFPGDLGILGAGRNSPVHPFGMALHNLGHGANGMPNDLQVMADDLMNQRLVPEDLLGDDGDDEGDSDDDVSGEDDEDDRDDETSDEYTNGPGLPLEADTDLSFLSAPPSGHPPDFALRSGPSRKRARPASLDASPLPRPVSTASEIRRLLSTALAAEAGEDGDPGMLPSEKLAKLSTNPPSKHPALRPSTSREQIFRALLKIKHGHSPHGSFAQLAEQPLEVGGPLGKQGHAAGKGALAPSVESEHEAAIVMSGMRQR